MKEFTTLKEHIDYFESIPEEKWIMNHTQDKDKNRCAIGHLFETECPGPLVREVVKMGLRSAGIDWNTMVAVNNRYVSVDIGGRDVVYATASQFFHYDTPKKRVLAYLGSLKK